MVFALKEIEYSESIGEEVMGKITTGGFSLEEELIMAAVNLLTSADTLPTREPRAAEIKGDQAWS
jgi:hypothetical protein